MYASNTVFAFVASFHYNCGWISMFTDMHWVKRSSLIGENVHENSDEILSEHRRLENKATSTLKGRCFCIALSWRHTSTHTLHSIGIFYPLQISRLSRLLIYPFVYACACPCVCAHALCMYVCICVYCSWCRRRRPNHTCYHFLYASRFQQLMTPHSKLPNDDFIFRKKPSYLPNLIFLKASSSKFFFCKAPYIHYKEINLRIDYGKSDKGAMEWRDRWDMITWLR